MSFRSLRSSAPQLTALILFFVIFFTTPALAQWSTPVRISEPGDCWYPQIIASGDTLHVVYENTGARYDKISYVRSTDAGLSWSEPIRPTERRGATVFPRIMENGSQLMVAWEQVFDSGYDRYNVGYAISGEEGASWDSALYIFNPNWVGIQNMAAAGSGPYVHVIIGAQVAYDFIFYDVFSTDFGSSWSSPEEVFACYEAGRPDMAQVDSAIHFVWHGKFEPGPPSDIRYIKSLDGGLTWSENLLLSTLDEHGSLIPAICLDGGDRVATCWMDGKYSPYMLTGDILARVSQDTGTTWGLESQASFNHFAWASDIISGAGDILHLVWEDESRGMFHTTIQYARSSDGGFSWSEPCWLDSTIYHNSRSPAMAVSNGRVYAVWNGYRAMPDSSALYFTYFPYEPDAIDDSNHLKLPDEIELSAYPNPFNSSVTINLYSEKGGEVRVCDINGKLIRRFIAKPGSHRLTWDGKGGKGEGLSSGVFFAEFQSGGHVKSLKLMYVK